MWKRQEARLATTVQSLVSLSAARLFFKSCFRIFSRPENEFSSPLTANFTFISDELPLDMPEMRAEVNVYLKKGQVLTDLP